MSFFAINLISLPPVLEPYLTIKLISQMNHGIYENKSSEMIYYDKNVFTFYRCYVENSTFLYQKQYKEVMEWYYRVLKEKLLVKIKMPGEYEMIIDLDENKTFSLLQFIESISDNMVKINVLKICSESDSELDIEYHTNEHDLKINCKNTLLNKVRIKYTYCIICQLELKNNEIVHPFSLSSLSSESKLQILEPFSMIEFNTSKIKNN